MTPSHITDLFCDLALLNEDDIIFDPCCGTGGFLVSAMKYMLEKAGSVEEKTKNIKSRQLIGIEKRNDMFSHVCSNMMMRGDGKSHIYSGDCFDASLKQLVKSQNPNVSFLNPPYQDGNAGEQLEFIENALECISKGGTCIAICQMSTVVSTSKSVTEVKRRLLEKHTLKAVLSMPDELFHPVAVVTCIIIFEAHIPHHETKETFFGYFKNDGFEKKKNKGRVNYKKNWEIIKNEWLGAYRNNKNIAGLSVSKSINHDDEWCAEAYIETDYNLLSDSNFLITIREHVGFNFLNSRINEIETESLIDNKILLTSREWRYFQLSKYFTMNTGHYYPSDSFEVGNTPLITASTVNNGVGKWTDIVPRFSGNKITIGKVSCSTFYQREAFCASSDVTILTNKNNLNQFVGMFLVTIINMEKFKWSYGRQIRLNDSINLKIKLPADKDGNPDWDFMEEYIKSLPFSKNL